MGETFADLVYETLCGMIHGEYTVPGVEDAFIEGGECEKLYIEIAEARDRLLQRLGLTDEDDDIEIISNYESVQRILALKMFAHGQKFH